MSEHGTRSRYIHGGCTCVACTQANSDYSARYAAFRRAEPNGSLLVDGSAVAAQVRQMLREGETYTSIAQITGLTVRTLERICESDPAPRVTSRVAEAITTLTPAPRNDRPDYLEAGPSIRRLRHLAAMGYSVYGMSKICGIPNTTLTKLITTDLSLIKTVHKRNAGKIEQMYETLKDQFPEGLDAEVARMRAKAKGYTLMEADER